MLFVIEAWDKPAASDVRRAMRPAHLEYLRGLGHAVKIAGPLLDPSGERPIGSLLILEAADRTDAERLLATDPYARRGLFARVEITPWKWVIGKPQAE